MQSAPRENKLAERWKNQRERRQKRLTGQSLEAKQPSIKKSTQNLDSLSSRTRSKTGSGRVHLYRWRFSRLPASQPSHRLMLFVTVFAGCYISTACADYRERDHHSPLPPPVKRKMAMTAMSHIDPLLQSPSYVFPREIRCACPAAGPAISMQSFVPSEGRMCRATGWLPPVDCWRLKAPLPQVPGGGTGGHATRAALLHTLKWLPLPLFFFFNQKEVISTT